MSDFEIPHREDPEPVRVAGRERELEELRRHMDGNSHAVVVVGPPGIGKTTFAKAFAERFQHLFFKEFA